MRWNSPIAASHSRCSGTNLTGAGQAADQIPDAENQPRPECGGASQAADLTAHKREIIARVGPELKKRGLIFIGIDVIADGYPRDQARRRPDVFGVFWECIEKKRAKG